MTSPVCSDDRQRNVLSGAWRACCAARPRVRAFLALLVALLGLFLPVVGFAFEPFVVRDIRVEGVQRTEAGTVFSYLPIKVGERIDDEKAAAAVKALYATGFFRDVRLEVQDGVLIVSVQERPTISRIDFVGNNEYDTETVKKALKEVGIAEARIFDRSALDRAEQEMKRQYITRGRYAAKITTTVTPQDRNRVSINFTIEEGEAAKIARINIVGNKAFTEKQLLSRDARCTTPGWFTWYTKNDQYSKQKLQADLESVRSFYQDRGYLEFTVESTQVSISPDKEDIYITINISEGGPYTVSDSQASPAICRCRRPSCEPRAGAPRRRVLARSGCRQSVKDISERLGADGYAFANVNAVPDIDKVKRTAAFTFYVDSGRRVYIRKISINGNAKTKDEVVRREIRQLEDAWYDGTRIERSKVRIKRLGYFDDVNIETPPVAGSPDQADIEVTVVEKATGSLTAGIGYSSSDGVVLNASISQQNIFGSGNALSASINTSKINRTISVAFTQPYWTVDGVSRTFEVYQRKTLDPDRWRSTISQYSARRTLGARPVRFGIPITETDAINVRHLRFEQTKLTLFSASPPVYINYVNAVRQYIDEQRTSRQRWLVARHARRCAVSQQGPAAERAGRGRPAGRRSAVLQDDLRSAVVHAAAGSTSGTSSLHLRGEHRLCRRPTGANRCRSSRRSTPAARARCVATRRPLWARATSTTTCSVASARSWATPKCSIRFSRETNPCALACSRTPGRSTSTDTIPCRSNQPYPGSQGFRYSAGVGLAWNSPIGPLKFSYALSR